MRQLKWGLLGVWAVLLITGCQRTSYTEASVQEAIAERQGQAQVEIEQGVRAAPPIVVENPTQNSAPPSGQRSSSDSGGFELPPPNRYDAPRPPSGDPPVQSPPPAVGDVKLDPQTGQYGIHPPGAPETYTIPLDRPQGQ